jgi:hypothetical protein
MKTTLLSILAVLALFVGSAFSQVKPYVDAGVGYQSTFTGTSSVTASNPSFNLGAGVEINSKRLLIDVNGQFNTQNVRNFVNYNTSAFAGTVTGTGYAKIGKNLLLGGGALYQDTVINGNLKGLIPSSTTTFVPLVGGGFQFSRDRVTALYELPGRSATNQRTVLLHNEFYVTKKGGIRLTQDVSGNSSVNQLTASGVSLSQRISGAQGSAGIKVVF